MFVNKTPPTSFKEIEASMTFVQKGGRWKLSGCKTLKKVAVIIPYRDRLFSLLILLRMLHPMLRRQQLDYHIFVVEQWDDYPFNKGKINNVGAMEAQKFDKFDCIVFQDVDLLPEHDRNFYDCPTSPRQLSPYCESLHYRRAAEFNGGGVMAVTYDDLIGKYITLTTAELFREIIIHIIYIILCIY